LLDAAHEPGETAQLLVEGRLPPFLAGGFECSSHRRADGVRLDLLRATRHDEFAAGDYAQLAAAGLRVARDGARWHLIEREPGRYDWSSLRPLVDAAQQAGVRVIWDLCHYGWPDHIDVWSQTFAPRFAEFTAACADALRRESGPGQFYCPVNEISYLVWRGADKGLMSPCTTGRGAELKRVMVKASAAATRAVREVDRRALFICAEPLIHVAPTTSASARAHRLAQYEALDMLLGLREPELGGARDLVDLVGLNFYSDNQWFVRGSTIPMGHFAYRPLSDLLAEVHARYGKPMFLAETGAEGRARPYWLNHVAGEVAHALQQGLPVRGICLYPILDYPGWDNGRLCRVGLFGEADAEGRRSVYAPLLEEARRAQAALAEAWSGAASSHER
jgi:beta-glucosidase/6-phospho-beta-glucosidase/beta-galactosidase